MLGAHTEQRPQEAGKAPGVMGLEVLTRQCTATGGTQECAHNYSTLRGPRFTSSSTYMKDLSWEGKQTS